MSEKQEMTLEVNGLHFHVNIEGEGEPLVLIMGLGAPGDKWAKNIEVYKQYFRCIFFDNRGAGRTDKPQAEAYSTTEMAEDAVGIMDALHIQKAHINGISMGGAIAQKLAILYPERVKSLILTSTFASVSSSFRRALETLRDAADQLDAKTRKHLNQWMTFSLATQNTNEALLLEAEKEDAAYPYPMPTYAYKAQCNACMAHNTAAELCRITAPTLVAAGECDLFVPMYKTLELCENIPNSTLYVCKDGGHVHEWEKLDDYNKVTLDFLRREHVSR